MALKFAANLNFLFTECSTSLAEKIHLASQAGFRSVEIPFPRNEIAEIIKAKNDTGMEIALMNIAVDAENYKFGSASIPGAENVFQQHLSETIDLAKILNCPKIHIMSGTKTNKEHTYEEYHETYQCNLRYAVEQLKKENLLGLIEPINKYSLPFYFMNCYNTAQKILENLNCFHLKLMLDVFHLQQICGDITHSFKTMSHLIGHIQIAQVPHRHEPNIAGELDYNYVFQLIENSQYNDWIGCEYKPFTTTVEGLKWVQNYNYSL